MRVCLCAIVGPGVERGDRDTISTKRPIIYPPPPPPLSTLIEIQVRDDLKHRTIH